MRLPLSRGSLLTLVAGSLAFALLRGLFLNGSLAALILAVVCQLVLPGWLLLRLWGGRLSDNILVRLMWILAGGLSMTVLLGSLFRLLGLPVWLYIVVLHFLMVVLALRPAVRTRPVSPLAKAALSGTRLALYGLLAVCVLVSLYVGAARSQLRWDAWEDPATFASWINWLVNDPDDPWLLTRRVTDTPDMIDDRYHTDGWPFVQAAWVWSSGVEASTFIWYLITPLFAWVTPLAFFAFVYELSRKEQLAVYSTAGLMLLSLLSVDYIGYDTFGGIPFSPYYGASAYQYLNISRYFSTAIMLPLALMIAVSYLQRPARARWLFALLAVPALGLMHARAITIFVVSMGAFTALYWLFNRTRGQALVCLRVGGVLLLGLAVPVVQRYIVVPAGVVEAQVVQASAGLTPSVLTLSLPVLGQTLIIRPDLVFYHPLIAIGASVGLLVIVLSRRPEALYAFGVTAAFLALLLLPGLAAVFIALVSPRIAHNFAIALPIGLSLGYMLDRIVTAISRRMAFLAPAASVLSTVVILVLVLEPVPIIAASGRDQIRVMNELQAARDIRPADEALLALLTQEPDLQLASRAVFLVPYRISSFIVETVPHALVAGGAAGEDEASQFLLRFFGKGSLNPFLDTEDLAYLDRWEVRFIVIEVTDNRLPQVEMRPDRFQLRGAAEGYRVYEVLDTQPDDIDALFQEMNALFAAGHGARWAAAAFDLVRPGGDVWQDIVAVWQDQAARDDRPDVQYGLAMSLLLAGRDEDALPLWRALSQAYPANPLLMDAVAQTSRHLGQADAAVSRLLAGLQSPYVGIRVRAAMLLLTGDFMYDISEEAVGRVLETTHRDFAAWDLLAERLPDEVRRRSALLMSRGYSAAADVMMARLLPYEVSPCDIMFRVALRLAGGQPEEALALLAPYLDPDTYVAGRWWHPDRWQVNTVAGLYDLLQGEIAAGSGEWRVAASHFERAIDQGYVVAGHVFAARALHQLGETAEAAAWLEALSARPEDQAALWAAAASLELARLDQDQVRVTAALESLNRERARLDLPPVTTADAPRLRSWLDMPPLGQVLVLETRTELDGSVHLRGLFGPNPGRAYPVEAWEARLFDPATYRVYGETRVASILVPGALTEWSISLDPSETAPYTPAFLALEAWSGALVHFQQALAELTLNPVPADEAAIARETDYVFDGQIRLVGYTGPDLNPDSLTLTLYWQTEQALSDDYQVLLHVIDEAGLLVGQGDGTPVGGRYPTSRWAPGLLIEDARRVDFDPPLPPGHYQVRIGLYRLADLQRLAPQPVDERVHESAVLVGEPSLAEP